MPDDLTQRILELERRILAAEDEVSANRVETPEGLYLREPADPAVMEDVRQRLSRAESVHPGQQDAAAGRLDRVFSPGSYGQPAPRPPTLDDVVEGGREVLRFGQEFTSGATTATPRLAGAAVEGADTFASQILGGLADAAYLAAERSGLNNFLRSQGLSELDVTEQSFSALGSAPVVSWLRGVSRKLEAEHPMDPRTARALQDGSWWKDAGAWGRMLGESSPHVATGIAVTALTGSPAIGLAVASAAEFGASWDEAVARQLDRGLSPEQARAEALPTAIVDAAIGAAFERLGLEHFQRAILLGTPGVRKAVREGAIDIFPQFARGFVSQGTVGAAEEIGTEVGQALNRYLQENDPGAWAELEQSIAQAGAAGFVMEGVLGGAGRHISSRLMREQMALEGQQQFDLERQRILAEFQDQVEAERAQAEPAPTEPAPAAAPEPVSSVSAPAEAPAPGQGPTDADLEAEAAADVQQAQTDAQAGADLIARIKAAEAELSEFAPQVEEDVEEGLPPRDHPGYEQHQDLMGRMWGVSDTIGRSRRAIGARRFPTWIRQQREQLDQLQQEVRGFEKQHGFDMSGTYRWIDRMRSDLAHAEQERKSLAEQGQQLPEEDDESRAEPETEVYEGDVEPFVPVSDEQAADAAERRRVRQELDEDFEQLQAEIHEGLTATEARLRDFERRRQEEAQAGRKAGADADTTPAQPPQGPPRELPAGPLNRVRKVLPPIPEKGGEQAAADWIDEAQDRVLVQLDPHDERILLDDHGEPTDEGRPVMGALDAIEAAIRSGDLDEARRLLRDASVPAGQLAMFERAATAEKTAESTDRRLADELPDDPKAAALEMLAIAREEIEQLPQFQDLEASGMSPQHPHVQALMDARRLHIAQRLEQAAKVKPSLRETRVYQDAVEAVREAAEGHQRTDEEIRRLIGMAEPGSSSTLSGEAPDGDVQPKPAPPAAGDQGPAEGPEGPQDRGALGGPAHGRPGGERPEAAPGAERGGDPDRGRPGEAGAGPQAGGRADRQGDPGDGGPGDGGGRVHQRPAAEEREGGGERGAAADSAADPDAGDGDGSAAVAPTAIGDFILEDPGQLAPGGKKAKFRGNIAAITLLRELDTTGRAVTADDQKILANYVGWGMFPEVFNFDGDWRKEAEELRSLLSAEEWESARESTINAHYTSPEIVEAMWQMVQQMGFDRGRILEPAVGVGNFLALLPGELRKNPVTGVELDVLTAKIAKLLYPTRTIRQMGYQDFPAPHDFYDLIISNIPFSGKVFPKDKEYRGFGAPIHDYYFLKSIDRVRPGGLVVFITSTFTMDKKAPAIRKELARKADLVASYRLPADTFASNAGTAVVTDIVILQKRAPGEPAKGPAWLNVTEVPDPAGGEAIPINEYYAANPQNVLGIVDRTGTMYRKDSVNVSRTDDFEDRLADAVARLPQVYTGRDIIDTTPRAPAGDRDSRLRTGSIIVEDGKVKRMVEGEEIEDVAGDFSEQDIAQIEGMLGIRDAGRELLTLETQDAPEDDIAAARKLLNERYDAFFKKWGALNHQGRRKLLADDPDLEFILGLENVTGTGVRRKVTKTDIFTKRTVRGAGRASAAANVQDAVVISLRETGTLDLSRMAELLKLTPEQLVAQLRASEFIFERPGGGFETREQYLSGNVKRKLLEARTAAEEDPRFDRNVDALEQVIPPDVPAEEIAVRFGSPWIPADDYARFIADLIGGEPADYAFQFQTTLGRWAFQPATTRGANHLSSAEARNYATDDITLTKVIEHTLSQKAIVIRTDGKPNPSLTAAAQQKVTELQDAFSAWIWEDEERRGRLERFYNDEFNNVRPRSYDGGHLQFPGMSPEVELRTHQKDAIWRIIQERTAYLGHGVGAGKTWTYGAAAMELKRLGIARKPAIIVPKSTIGGFEAKTRLLYPGARILSTAGANTPQQRRRLLAQIATGDWDLVILTYEHLGALQNDPAVEAEYVREEMAELERVIQEVERTQPKGARGAKSSRFVKPLAGRLQQMKERLKELLTRQSIKGDDAVTFEETGIDWLFVDEAHNFKSLPVHSTLQVKGIPTNDSGRAVDLFQKVRHVQNLQNGGGVVFGSGTPIDNSMAEVFVNMKYLQPRELKDRGIESFDAWASTFGEIVTEPEFSVTGQIKEQSRFRRFVNMRQLAYIHRQVLDMVNLEDVEEVKRPRKVDRVIESPMSEAQRIWLAGLPQRVKEMDPRDPSSDNILKLSGEAGNMSIDMRLVDPSAMPHDEDKINLVSDEIARLQKEHPGSTHLIFLNSGYNGTVLSPDFKIVPLLVEALGKRGIPADKIIDFSRITTASAKDRAEARLRSGDAIVGIGHRSRIGEGINVQDHLIAVHHLDSFWKPGVLVQSDGRAWRQGNRHETIYSIRYVTVNTETNQASFDTFKWQTVDRKLGFIKQFQEGDLDSVNQVMEEQGEEMTPAQVMAIASGNPKVLELVKKRQDLARLQLARASHQRVQARARTQVERNKWEIQRLGPQIALARADAERAEANSGDNFKIILRGVAYDREAAAARLHEISKELAPSFESGRLAPAEIGQIRGFTVELTKFGALIHGEQTYELKVGARTGPEESARLLNSIIARTAPGFMRNAAEKAQAGIALREEENKRLEPRLGQEFDRAEELAALEVEVAALAQEVEVISNDLEAKVSDARRVRTRLEEMGRNDPDKLREIARQMELSDRGSPSEVAQRLAENIPADQFTDLIGPTDPFRTMGAMADPELEKTRAGRIRRRLPSARELAGRKNRSRKARYPFENPEVEDRWQASYGVGKLSLAEKWAKWAGEWRETFAAGLGRGSVALPHAFTVHRTSPEGEKTSVERKGFFGPARQAILNMRKVYAVGQWQTAQALRRVIRPMTDADFELFSRIVQLRDLAETEGALPWGMTPEEVESELARLEAIAKDNTGVQRALDERRATVRAATADYINAAQTVDEAWSRRLREKLHRKEYYRHQVLYWMHLRMRDPESAQLAQGVIEGGGKKVQLRTGRGFLKRREGSEADINSSFLQAEWEWLSIMRADTVLMGEMAKLRRYDIRRTLVEQARQHNENLLREKVLQQTRAVAPAGVSDEEIEAEAAKEFRKRFNQKTAIAFDRIRGLIENDELEVPDDGSLDAIFEAGRGAFSRIAYQWASWAAREEGGAEPGGESQIAARQLLKAASERRKLVRETLGDDRVVWEDLIPEGYEAVHIRPGQLVFTVETIPERLAQDAVLAGGLGIDIKPEDLRRIMAIGQMTPWVLPRPLAKVMAELHPTYSKNVMARFFRGLNRGWKWMQLMLPHKWPAYRFRNQTEVEKSLTMHRASLAKIPQAAAQLARLYAGKSVEPEVAEWYRRAGSGLYRIQEVGEVDLHAIFKEVQFHESAKPGGIVTLPGWLMKQYTDKLGRINDALEGLYRLAAYLDHLEQLRATGKPRTFAASRPDEIKEMMRAGSAFYEDIAHRLSNEMLGAYDDVSMWGDTLRRGAMPFWSFPELNTRTYYRALMNIVRDEDAMLKGAETLHDRWRRAGPIAGAMGLRTGVTVGTAAAKVAVMYAGFKIMLDIINALVMGISGDDELEKDLPDDVRNRPHLTFGRDSQGRVIFFDRVGTSHDMLQWFGLEGSYRDIADLVEGRTTLRRFVADTLQAAPSKVLTSFGPVKAPAEMIYGKRLFPEPLDPRPIRDKWEYLFGELGFREEYMAISGRPVEGGSYVKSRADRFFARRAVPGQSDYWHIQSEKWRYLESRGKGGHGGGSFTERDNALYDTRMAIRLGDQRGAERALAKYFALGGTPRNMMESLARLHPLGGLTRAERADFYQGLDEHDQERFERAEEYYQTHLLPKGRDLDAILEGAVARTRQ